MKLFIYPFFGDKDTGEGGIRRVVEAQKKYLPLVGVEIVDDPNKADLCAYHGGDWLDTDRPVVLHCHGLYWAEYDWANWAHELNNRVIDSMRRAALVTAPSKWVQHIIQRGMMLDAPVLYHGVDPDDWTEEPASYSWTPESYVLWNKTRPDPVCDPSPVNKLASLSRDVQFVSTFGEDADNIRLTDRTDSTTALEYVRNAGIYLATTRETFGIGTLEAMAAGVPILGWRWGGQAEFVEHKVTGYLATPGDYDDLLYGLRWCIENREKLGKAARLTVLQSWTWPSIMAQYVTLYRQVLRRSIRKPGQPKVSVVITCYNLAETLPRAVDSVLKQDQWNPLDTEIVIVNDNSPDDTAAVSAKLAAKRKNIKVVTNESNLYLSGALNAGISAANGRYIVPLDADNELGPLALRLLSDALDKGYKNPTTGKLEHIDIAYGAMELVDESGVNEPFTSGWPGQFNYTEQMRHRNQIPSTSMYRKSVWERVGGYRRRCRTAEDADFWCRATSFGAIPRRVTDAVTLVYHDRSDSMSHVQQDWAWHDWYTWSRIPRLTPFGAARTDGGKVNIPTYEPALITVVIPVGPGHAQYVQDAVDSLVSQTFTRWRCVIVNDSGEKLPLLPPFVEVIEVNREIPVGPSLARNIAISSIRTALFVPLDADDYLQPDALERLYITWKSLGPEYYVYGDWYVQETKERYNAPEYDCSELTQRLPHAVTALYTKAQWEKVGGFDEQLQAWEDWDFVLALAANGFCGARCDTPIFQYRMSTGGRREAMYAKRDELKKFISDKWQDYIVKGAPLMACSGCGKRNSQQTAALFDDPNRHVEQAAARMSSAVTPDGTVLIEYIGGSPGVTYRGQVTGTSYKFGNVEGRSKKYVFARDAESFLARVKEFRIATVETPSQPVLEASGPPVREVVEATA